VTANLAASLAAKTHLPTSDQNLLQIKRVIVSGNRL
jgi:hypothetical protein